MLRGREMTNNTIIPSNTFDIWTRFDNSLGLKLSGHTDILTESSHLKVVFYKTLNYKIKNNIEALLIILKNTKLTFRTDSFQNRPENEEHFFNAQIHT